MLGGIIDSFLGILFTILSYLSHFFDFDVQFIFPAGVDSDQQDVVFWVVFLLVFWSLFLIFAYIVGYPSKVFIDKLEERKEQLRQERKQSVKRNYENKVLCSSLSMRKKKYSKTRSSPRRLSNICINPGHKKLVFMDPNKFMNPEIKLSAIPFIPCVNSIGAEDVLLLTQSSTTLKIKNSEESQFSEDEMATRRNASENRERENREEREREDREKREREDREKRERENRENRERAHTENRENEYRESRRDQPVPAQREYTAEQEKEIREMMEMMDRP